MMFILFICVPSYFVGISKHAYSSLFFGYQEKPLLIMMISLLSLFFDYLSLIIPRMELFSIRSFSLIRKPTIKRSCFVCMKVILPYFIPFLLIKLYALTIFATSIVFVWIGISIIEWFLCFYISLNLKIAIPNGFFLFIFIIVRIIAHLLF
ncbi:hypothetical protein [Melissococcus plutonius]|nr:hypothetical protein [Melissococcus plutonius]MCV2520169.1 hypothetical protein [Melissococcus plutonius]MCV2527639.1 hypothetical protein [Melissococcus plutonius]